MCLKQYEIVASATQLECTSRGLEQMGQRLKQVVECYKV